MTTLTGVPETMLTLPDTAQPPSTLASRPVLLS